MSNFATRFKEEIDKKGLRPSDVAIMTGINKATISQYLSGKYLPKQDKLLKIAAVLKVKPSELDDWDESEAPHRPPSQNLLELIKWEPHTRDFSRELGDQASQRI